MDYTAADEKALIEAGILSGCSSSNGTVKKIIFIHSTARPQRKLVQKEIFNIRQKTKEQIEAVLNLVVEEAEKDLLDYQVKESEYKDTDYGSRVYAIWFEKVK